ncbi:MAG: hypothetical protein ACI9WU_003116, partial [Myxococcota bacterium]
MMRRNLFLFVMATLIAGCRPDPGNSPNYGGEDFANPQDLLPEPLVAHDPFVDGASRLSLGIFYEGGFSATVPVDGVAANYFIYGLESDGSSTFSQTASAERVEGKRADRIIHSGFGWWGGGLHWTAPTDLTGWTTLHISLRSDAAAFEAVEIRMGVDGADVALLAGDYGWSNDGAWH